MEPIAPLMTVADVTALLIARGVRISETSVRRAAGTDRLPAMRTVRGIRLFRPTDVEQYAKHIARGPRVLA